MQAELKKKDISGLSFTSVESSNVDAVAHDGKDLYVRFKRGGVYQYSGVSKELYDQLLSADSVGGFLNKAIKPSYKFERVD